MSVTRIEVKDLVVRYGDQVAVNGVSFTVDRGEHLTLLGPSGCGKTTTLRAIAGLEQPSGGSIGIDGQTMYDSTERKSVQTEQRGVSMVFQSYAIWPHMSVFDNVAYGLRVRKQSKADIKTNVERALDLVQMRHLADRGASKLSGGQQQRVALARAIAFSPTVVLFDEPLSNLDAKLRAEMRVELRELQRRLGITAVYVTHDQEEALAISDRVIVMNVGVIEQIGTPDEVYENPASPFVYEFLGNVNLFHSRLHRGRAWIDGIEVDAPEHAEAEELAAVAYVRPHDIEVDRTAQGDAALAARVTHVLSVGPIVRLELVRDDSEDKNPIQVEISKERFRELQLVRGDQVFIKPRRFDLFPRRIH